MPYKESYKTRVLILANKNREPVLDTTPAEPVVCKHFGCGKELNLAERLAGDHCTNHMNSKQININIIIKSR